MQDYPNQQKNEIEEKGQATPEVEEKKVRKGREKARDILKVAGEKIMSISKKTWNARKTVVHWGSQQVSGGYVLLSKALKSSKVLDSSTSKAILTNVSSAYETATKTGRKITNSAAVIINAILASDFSHNMESWLGDMFNEGIPSLYDSAADAVYNATSIGGGYLHRLFDGSHTILGMWQAVRDASPDDSLLEEVVGFATAYGKDLSSTVGMPLFGLSPATYDDVSSALNNTFNIPKAWFSDLLQVNATELIGTSIAAIAVALHWKKKQVKQFASLAGSLGIMSVASANPALAVVALATLAKSFINAKEKENYSEAVNGLAEGGVGTGAFLATAFAVGGPVWIGLLAGMCVGSVVHKNMKTVQIDQINAFIKDSMKRIADQAGMKPQAPEAF